jgi:chitinase
LDWEFPKDGAEATNFLYLLQEVRKQMNWASTKYLLAIATTINIEKLVTWPLAAMSKELDWLGLMSYDFSIGFDHTRHDSPLFASTLDPYPYAKENYNSHKIVSHFINQKVPKSKIILGISLYGRGFTVQTNDNEKFGLYRKRTCDSGSCNGEFLYKDIVTDKLGGGYKKYYDSSAAANYLYNSATGKFISYTDKQSALIKSKYVNDLGIAGIMYWEISQDIYWDENLSLMKFFKNNIQVESNSLI